jgi:hypothetical protein
MAAKVPLMPQVVPQRIGLPEKSITLRVCDDNLATGRTRGLLLEGLSMFFRDGPTQQFVSVFL